MVSLPQTVDEFIASNASIFIQRESNSATGLLAATKSLSQIMMRKAQTMAFSDAFLLISILLGIAFMLAPVMDRATGAT
ncbi:hypothetical protein [Hafnia alvei]|uniref:hypothetical protein n=1 Tax=Hafnia alvei TaxID=569 RepID=UPI000E07D6F6|nr:hypothetical protein [Hafnia alvei]TBM14987.1 hypothetical protein EYY84_09355 [Hafnia alvei]STQ69066.1 Uncharacterised protein [Hafnia alvei]